MSVLIVVREWSVGAWDVRQRDGAKAQTWGAGWWQPAGAGATRPPTRAAPAHCPLQDDQPLNRLLLGKLLRSVSLGPPQASLKAQEPSTP